MVAEHLTLDSPAALLGALLLLWFHTVWQAYVIEATQARLSGLREIWREIVALDPAWRHLPEVRTVHRLLEASSANMPRLSLLSLLIAALTASRAQGAAISKIYADLNRLGSKRLREESTGMLELATRYVALAALKRSLLVWALAPLFVAAFIVWSVHWQLRVVVEGLLDLPLDHLRAAHEAWLPNYMNSAV